MATEMPVDEESMRNIPGISDAPELNEDGGAEVELDLDDSEIEELPDGSAVVTMDNYKGPEDDEDFYSNMAEETIDSWDLDKIGLRHLTLIEKDKEARELRDKQYEEGIRRTGMGNDAPGGANFMGASKVVHPVMAEACVDFASRAIKEMFPPDGPCRTKILGKVDAEKLAVAERKRDYMNWQLTEQMEEFRDEQEQLLTQLPLGGSQFMKIWYDETKRRPCAEFVPIDNILLPFSSANFYTAQRVTEVQDITDWEFKRRISSGLYRDTDYIRASTEPDQTRSEKANDKIEGKNSSENEDGVRRVYCVYTWLELDDDPRTKGESAPYIMMIDEMESKVIGLYRNWEDGDDTFGKLDWIVEFKFIPWRGAYAVGLPHLIGGLAAGLTGSLRALLDAAHINNAPTMLKLKGARISGQTQQIEVTQVAEIEGAPGVDDVRKIAMPLPFNPPSPVLFELMGFLEKAAKGVVTTAEEKIADVNSQAPVGTTQALIEQGAAVFSAIHARLHTSQSRVLKILGRLNRWYLDDQKKGDVVAELDIRKEDFIRNTDIVPVSDPHIFSETQRMAQIQAVMSVMKDYPQLFDQKAVVERFLKQIKIPGVNELMKGVPDVEKRDPANENVAMAIGQAAFAYIEQDHLAHIQSHLDFGKDPIFGANPLMAQSYIPNALEHIKQHLTLWYLNRMNGYVTKAAGKPVTDYDMPELTADIDKLFSAAGRHVSIDTEQTFQGIMPVIQKMMQTMQQSQPKPPLDPATQVLLETSKAETDRRAAKDQADTQIATDKNMSAMQLAQAKLMQEKQISDDRLDVQERIASANLTHDVVKLQNEQFNSQPQGY